MSCVLVEYYNDNTSTKHWLSSLVLTDDCGEPNWWGMCRWVGCDQWLLLTSSYHVAGNKLMILQFFKAKIISSMSNILGVLTPRQWLVSSGGVVWYCTWDQISREEGADTGSVVTALTTGLTQQLNTVKVAQHNSDISFNSTRCKISVIVNSFFFLLHQFQVMWFHSARTSIVWKYKNQYLSEI